MSKHTNHRQARTVTLEDDGQTYTFNQLGQKFGIKSGTIRSRWDRHGRHEAVSIALCTGQLEKRQGNIRELVEYPGHGKITFPEIARIHKDLGRGFQFFRARWAAFGRPVRVTPEIFTMSNDDVKEQTGFSAWTTLRGRTGLADARFNDPNFLPDIPFNDLAHLSGSTNTGAARKGCDEWDTRKTFKGGSAFSGFCSMGPCYQGKQ